MENLAKGMDPYEALRLILDMHPSRAPASPYLDEILRILFTPEEVAVAVHMSFRPRNVKDIARAASLPDDRARALLEGMAEKPSSSSGRRTAFADTGCFPRFRGFSSSRS